MAHSMIRNRQLSSSKTQYARSYDLFRFTHPLIDFVLVIRTGKPGTKQYREETYAVQCDPEAGESAYGFFLLKNSGKLGDDDIYFCWFPADFDRAFDPVEEDNPDTGRCTCFAGKTQKHCKHRDALQDFVRFVPEIINDLVSCYSLEKLPEHQGAGN